MASRCPPALLCPVLWPLWLFLRVTSSAVLNPKSFIRLLRLAEPPFTPAEVSRDHCGNSHRTELSQGPAHFRLYRKEKTFQKPRYPICSNDKTLSFPHCGAGCLWVFLLTSFLFSVQNSAGSEQELLVERRTGKDYLVSKAGYCEGLGSVDSGVKV